MTKMPTLTYVIDQYVESKFLQLAAEQEDHIQRSDASSDVVDEARRNAERWRDVLAVSLAALKINRIPDD
jgi:hypothetical protein